MITTITTTTTTATTTTTTTRRTTLAYVEPRMNRSFIGSSRLACMSSFVEQNQIKDESWRASQPAFDNDERSDFAGSRRCHCYCCCRCCRCCCCCCCCDLSSLTIFISLTISGCPSFFLAQTTRRLDSGDCNISAIILSQLDCLPAALAGRLTTSYDCTPPSRLCRCW